MKQKELILILIPSFVLTILWVVFSIYHNYVSSTIKDPLTYQIVPIENKFDLTTVESIKKRSKVDPLYQIESKPTSAPELNQSDNNQTIQDELTTPEVDITPVDDTQIDTSPIDTSNSFQTDTVDTNPVPDEGNSATNDQSITP